MDTTIKSRNETKFPALQSVFLRNGERDDANDLESAKAVAFGLLADRAMERLVHYKSDLYRDAQWLSNDLVLGQPFYYGVRNTGTSIYHDLDFALVVSSDEVLWQVTIRFQPSAYATLGTFYADFNQVFIP